VNISGNPSTYASSHAQRLLAHLLQQARGAGQNQPGGDSASATDGPPAAPPAGPLPGGGAQAFVSKTLASLLSVQEDGSASGGATAGASGASGSSDTGASKFADKLMKSADTNGDGELSADEIAAALGGTTASSDLSAAISKLDTDGDGQLNTSELTAALEAHRSGHAHHHARASADDLAAKLIGGADTDGDGSLSLAEVESTLGGADSSNSSNVSDGFNKLDTDGDGKLSASELSAALTAFRAAHDQNAQGQNQAATVSA